MNVIKVNDIATFKTPRGVTAKKILENQSFKIMNLLLQPGEVVEKHDAPVDIFFYVVKGKGYIQENDEEVLLEANDILYCMKKVPHGLRAGEEEFNVLVVFNQTSG
ncbi:MAG: cupin domain-containing protein [Eubacteriales bacterium]|jgi:quercetin dioxygenase-like cupin family protein